MRDAFDVLYREGRKGSPKLLSESGYADRLIGRPGRCAGLIRLLEYVQKIRRRMVLSEETKSRLTLASRFSVRSKFQLPPRSSSDAGFTVQKSALSPGWHHAACD